MDHPDHQDAIASEKLQLLKISYSKAEQKQAIVGVLNTDRWLAGTGSAVEVLAGFGFSPDVEDFDLRFQRCCLAVIGSRFNIGYDGV